MQYFTPDSPRHYTRSNLPHWSIETRICFATFRLGDSLPASVVRSYKEKYEQFCNEPKNEGLSEAEMLAAFSIRWHNIVEEALDAGHGGCWLAQPNLRRIVEDVLRHFDGVRYKLLSYVLMPNHVHVLFKPADSWNVQGILASWKSYSAREANKLLGREGKFWQRESFDRIIRSDKHFVRCAVYIYGNPKRCRANTYSYWESGEMAEVRNAHLW